MNTSRVSVVHLSLAVMAMALSCAQGANVGLGAVDWSVSGVAGVITGGTTVPNSPLENAQFGYVSTAGPGGSSNATYNTSPLVLRSEGRGTENQTNGTKVRLGSFQAVANEKLDLYFNYVSTDGRGYDDYAWARLIDAGNQSTAAWLFTARSTSTGRGQVVPGKVLDRQVNNDLPKNLDAILNDGASIGFNVSSTEWDPLGDSSGSCWDSANTCGPTGWIKSSFTIASTGTYYLEFGVNNWGDEAYDSALAFDFTGLNPATFSAPSSSVPEPPPAAMMALELGLVAIVISRRQRSRSKRKAATAS
jgi:hypothetical protein